MEKLCKIVLLVFCMALYGCSHKTMQNAESTTDTTYIYKTDSVKITDTLRVEQCVSVTDSIVDKTTTYVVLDTTGNVVYKYTYRDRGVYHNKDALSSSNHVSSNEQKQNNNERKATTFDSKLVKTLEHPPTLLSRCRTWLLFFIAIGVVLYIIIYQKRK